MTRFAHVSLPGNRASFSRFWGDFRTNSYRENLERKGKHPLEKLRKSNGDTSPKLQISVSCRGQTCLELRPKKQGLCGVSGLDLYILNKRAIRSLFLFKELMGLQGNDTTKLWHLCH